MCVRVRVCAIWNVCLNYRKSPDRDCSSKSFIYLIQFKITKKTTTKLQHLPFWWCTQLVRGSFSFNLLIVLVKSNNLPKKITNKQKTKRLAHCLSFSFEQSVCVCVCCARVCANGLKITSTHTQGTINILVALSLRPLLTLAPGAAHSHTRTFQKEDIF